MKVTFDFSEKDLILLSKIDDEMSGIVFEDIASGNCDDAIDAAELANKLFITVRDAFAKKKGENVSESNKM